jgi:hypothetical protein
MSFCRFARAVEIYDAFDGGVKVMVRFLYGIHRG